MRKGLPMRRSGVEREAGCEGERDFEGSFGGKTCEAVRSMRVMGMRG